MPKVLFLLLLTLIIFPISTAQAQGAAPTPEASAPASGTGPKYIIQVGDSLYSIASRFGVSLSDLLVANNISDANNITAGTPLVIPGLPGITGTLTTEVIGYGDTLKNLSRRTQIPLDLLARLNHVTSPTELFAGDSIILHQSDTTKPLTRSVSLARGETLLEAAVIEQTDPWLLSTINELKGTWDAIPGDILYAPGAGSGNIQRITGLPSAFINVTVNPLPVIQGGTTIINVETQPGVQLAGSFTDQALHFFSLDANKYVAMQGVYALPDPGPYPLMLIATLPNGTKQSFEQMVVVQAGNYPTDPLLSVSSQYA
jgi:LysM repeat protein